jgi:hypothetical protein
MTTWRELITSSMSETGETFADVAATTLSEDELDRRFNSGFGGSEGVSFTLWTKGRVYFPVVYDGSEWVGSVPRDPCDEATPHQGGQ